jgi:hypothetical protein
MKTSEYDQRTDWPTPLRGHLVEMARYCGVPVVTIGVWWIAGVPDARRSEVEGFARVITALERQHDPRMARALLKLSVRAAEERRLLQSWRRRPVVRRSYRVVVRKT